MNIGVQFKNMNSEDGSFTLDENLFGGTSVEGDQVITLNAKAWNLDTYDKQVSGEGWAWIPASGDPQEFVASLRVNKGDFVYYIPSVDNTATSIPVSGAIAELGEQSVTFEVSEDPDAQWMFPLVNPFPIDTTWGDLNAFTKEGDQIVLLDANAWNLDTYDRQPDGEGWALIPADGSAQEIINEPTKVFLKAGEAAYYIPTETVTWTVTL